MRTKQEKGICSVPGCGRMEYAHGYCNRHWQQWRNHGKVGRSNRDPNEIISFGEVSIVKMYDPNGNVAAVVAVDTDDVARISGRRWHLDGSGYATSRVNGIYTKMHCLVMGQKGVDHIDGNTFNNRKSNLRVATHQQNTFNCGVRGDSKSGFKGVTYHKATGRWRARIGVNYQQINLGEFDTPEEAALAYNEAAQKYHGEFAFLNNVPAFDQGQVQQ